VKRCFKCRTLRPLSEFYAHPMMADGHLNKCKECARTDVRANRKEKLDYYRAYDRRRNSDPDRLESHREYAATERGRAVARRGGAKWAARNPHKRRAHFAVNNAIRDGKLKRQPCEKCGGNAQAHHDDYSKPLDVRWLCTRHHADRHKELRSRETNQ
jgi:hypothetical protein